MIRFSCNSCGNSLRADDSIVGRKSQCSDCGAVFVVPAKSTRSSGKKAHSKPKQSTESSNPDMFDDMDMLISESTKRSPTSQRSPDKPKKRTSAERKATARAMSVADPTESPTATPSDADTSAASTIFRPAAPKKSFAAIFMTIAFVAALLVLGGLVYWLGSGRSGSQPTSAATDFENTGAVFSYGEQLAELRKYQLGLEFAGEGFLAAKDLPKSALADIEDLQDRVTAAANDDYAIVEGNSLYAAGKTTEAKRLIENETKKLSKLRDEVAAKTQELKKRTYTE